MGCHITKSRCQQASQTIYGSDPSRSIDNIIITFDQAIEGVQPAMMSHKKNKSIEIKPNRKISDNGTPKFGCLHSPPLPKQFLLINCMKKQTNSLVGKTSEKRVCFKDLGNISDPKSRRKFRQKYDISNLV